MEGKPNSGLYVLVIELVEHARIRVGALADLDLEPGWYVYTGSARRNLRQRVERHRRPKNRIRWHIDYQTSHPVAQHGRCSPESCGRTRISRVDR